MKIAYITAGAAGMFCGSCLNDNTLVTALCALGHDALLIPTYTPIRTDEVNQSQERVFFGGINVYLQQKSRFFRWTPSFFDRLLDAPFLLRWVSRFASSTKAEDLGDLTISMLKGKHGYQVKEALKLTAWLKKEIKPDVIHLTNALLSGLADILANEVGVPVVCSLQGDDIFLNALPEPFQSKAIELISANSSLVNRYVASSYFYADSMAAYLKIPREKIGVIQPGLNIKYHTAGSNAQKAGNVLGYFARICPEKGFHNLVNAWIALRLKNQNLKIKFKASGWLGESNKQYYLEQYNKIKDANLLEDFEYCESPDLQSKIRFFDGIDLLCVPTEYLEPKGLYVLEAWAQNVPVLQPNHASFPELLNKAGGGGWLYAPGNQQEFIEKLEFAFSSGLLLKQQALLGHNAVIDYFNSSRMAEETLSFYQRMLSGDKV